MFLNILLLFTLVAFTNSAKLPDYFKKCNSKSGLNECVKENIISNVKSIAEKGDKSIKLNTLLPMKVKHIDLQATPSLKIILEDVEFSGFETTKLKDVDLNLDKNTLKMDMNFDYFTMIGKYDINGRILVLPIVGHGRINLTGIDNDAVYNGKLDTIDKNGKKYYKVIEEPMTIVPHRLHFQLDNLFNGDERLGTEMNRFLNENWKDVFEEVNSAVTNTVRALITTVVNAYLTNIPISELVD